MSSDASKPNTSTKKKGGSTKRPKSNENKSSEPVSLQRGPRLGMDPVNILTGYYGSRGERIRHTVHHGALKMPKAALDILEESRKETGLSPPTAYKLPGLDAVVRPCVDPKMDSVVVTHLSLEKVTVQQPPIPPSTDPITGAIINTQPSVVHVLRTRVENRSVRRTTHLAQERASTERIRGGGDGVNTPGTNVANTTPHATAPSAIASTSAPTPTVPTSAAMPAQAAMRPESQLQSNTPSGSAVPLTSTSNPAGSVPAQRPQAQPASTPVVSSSAVPTAAAAVPAKAPSTKVEPAPPVQTLVTKPEPQWEQHRPGPNDEMVTPADQLSPRPAWYKKTGVADIERTMLPEWFNKSATHRTPESYIQTREKIIKISETIANRHVTNSMVRRSVAGDAGSLQRLRDFLTSWGIVNEDAINDSAPTPGTLRESSAAPLVFDIALKDELINAVVEQSRKRRKIEQENDKSNAPIDWEAVALHVGQGATAGDCERTFLSLQLDQGSNSTTADNPGAPVAPVASHDASKLSSAASRAGKVMARQEFIRELVATTSPDVVRKVTDAALRAADSENLKQAQSGAILGLVAAQAVDGARKQEESLSSVLSQLVNQRMEKLENRLAMLDDVEGILEAEKLALELERRDLYTARCRHWFGGS